MNKRLVTLVGTVLLAGTPLLAKSQAVTGKKASAQETLVSGKYSAGVKAIVCEGCGAFIEETLKKQNGLTDVAVDQAKKTVMFSVKEGATVKLADLQKALKNSADQMGMGADYTLQNVKKLS